MFPYYILFFVEFVLCVICMSMNNTHKRNIVATTMFIILIFFGSFRGDFTTDYSAYQLTFERMKTVSIMDFFTFERKLWYVEKGYAFLNYVLGKIFDSSISIFIITTILIVYPVWKGSLRTNAPEVVVLLYLCLGPYFVSFNITREIVASALFVLLVKYIEEESFLKYAIGVLLVSTIHTTAIFMLPFYFLLKLKINRTNAIVVLLISIVSYILCDPVIDFLDRVIYSSKFAMRSDSVGTESFMAIVVPMIMALFTFVVILLSGSKTDKNIEPECKINTIYCNAFYYWIICFVLQTKFFYFGRMTTFFSVLAIFGTATALATIKNTRQRNCMAIAIIMCSMLYYFRFGHYFSEYYFIDLL